MTYFSLAILILTLGASLLRGRFFCEGRGFTRMNDQFYQIIKIIFIFSVVVIFSLLLYQVWQQFQIWSREEVSKFLIPPYQSINYFLFYAGTRFFGQYLLSLAAATLFLLFAEKLNRKYEKRFFHPEEPYLGALAIFLVSHPGWIFYSIFIIFIYLLIHIYSLLITHYSLFRLSLYYLWLPTAIFVILIQKWLEALPLWSLLKI